MSRFFKSAAFPILIVVVLAFFAQKLIGSSHSSPSLSYGALYQEVQQGQIKSITLDQKDNSVSYTTLGGQHGSTGYPDGEVSQLINSAIQHDPGGGQSVNVQSKSSNGWLSLLTYLLPFVIFIAFWIFLMNQVQGGGTGVDGAGDATKHVGRRAIPVSAELARQHVLRSAVLQRLRFDRDRCEQQLD
jgi:cell division protease FtsH